MTTRYILTKKGRNSVARWRSGPIPLPDTRTSFPESSILRYLRGRKTPATVSEIAVGTGFSGNYVRYNLSGLLARKFVSTE